MKTILKTISIAVALLVATAFLARADERDDQIKALQQQLRQQNERLNRLEQLLNQQGIKQTPPPNPVTPPATSPAPPLEQAAAPIQSQATNIPPAKPQPPSVSIGENGLLVESADHNFSLKLGTLLQFDMRNYFDDGGIRDNDMFLVRRARINVDARLYRDFAFRIQPEFGGSSTALRDAFVNYRYRDWLQFQAGKFKSPIGLEQLQSDTTTLFIERSLVSDINPSRDVGGQIWGKPLGGLVEYAAGVFNGVGDGNNSGNLDTDGEKSVASRIFVYPFKNTDLHALQNLGLGVGGSYARPDGSGELPSGNGYATEGQQQFFTYAKNVVADGEHWRVSPQAWWYLGSWCLLAEYVTSAQKVSRADLSISDTLRHSAWQVAAGYVLTGENASPDGVIPKSPFNPLKGNWGALQAVARISSLDIDDHAFSVFADPDTSASKANSWAVGLNWFLNRNIRASMDFFNTRFDGGSRGPVSGQDELALFGRLQLAF